ncbi:MAG: hypothetical protein E7077_14315 [Bacteroidales bacterium]|jgi:hypothetical protein|nr:hypothetical protein [Bacteroidales bacterium]
MKKHPLFILSLISIGVVASVSSFARKKKEYYVKSVKHDMVIPIDNDTLYKYPSDTTSANDVVDLGLPSGTIWSICNIGAVKPEDYGYYFAWGERREKVSFDKSTYTWIDSRSKSFLKYTPENDYRVLDSKDDAATVNWGEDWRTPTDEEINELIDFCQYSWTEINGVKGARFTGANGKSIFFPAAGFRIGSGVSGADSYGYYWSSSVRVGLEDYAHYLNVYSDKATSDNIDRFLGLPIRPVRKK